MMGLQMLVELGRVMVETNIENLGKFETHNSDGVPITTLHISNLPKDAPRSQILATFSKYGKITNSYFKYAPNGCSIFYCFVTYADMCNALKARIQPTKINNLTVKVSPADPWHQKSNKPLPIKKEPRYQTKDDNIVNILNEDCFRNILSYLPLHEIIRSERVSKKWRSLVKIHLQSYREFKARLWNSTIVLNTSVLHGVLKKIGRNLKVLHLDQEWASLEQKVAFLISKFCPNLTELLILGLRSRNWTKILHECTELKTLVFSGCPDICDNTFKFCRAEFQELVIHDTHFTLGKFLSYMNLGSLTKLEMVNLSVNEIQLTKSFVNLKSLVNLCLDNVNMSFSKTNEILKCLPNLTQLTLCNMLLNKTIMESVTQLHHLEKLRISINTCLNNIMIRTICKNCPKLKSLEITRFDEMLSGQYFVTSEVITDQTIRAIFALKDVEILNLSGLMFADESFLTLASNQNRSKLQEISFRGNKKITEITILNVFTCCPDIKKFDIGNCSNIFSSIVEKLVEMIHMKECEPNRYSLITTWSDKGPKTICQCLNVKLELFDDIFLVGMYGSDEESFHIYLDGSSASYDSMGSFD